ncbi:hypothetical protein B0T09DRAFT_349323, partial [Sordaria sp. MPI-SDFR-AT-0083]
MHAAYCTQVISFTSFVMALPEETLELSPDRKRSREAQRPAFLMPITDARIARRPLPVEPKNHQVDLMIKKGL